MSLSQKQNLFMWGGIILAAQIAFAAIMYETEYSNIISVRQYQQIEDVNHNKAVIDLNRCLITSASNYLDNWNRICKAYGLGEGCGLPKDTYTQMGQGFQKDNATCAADHQVPAVSNPGEAAYQDESGNQILKP